MVIGLTFVMPDLIGLRLEFVMPDPIGHPWIGMDTRIRGYDD